MLAKFIIVFSLFLIVLFGIPFITSVWITGKARRILKSGVRTTARITEVTPPSELQLKITRSPLGVPSASPSSINWTKFIYEFTDANSAKITHAIVNGVYAGRYGHFTLETMYSDMMPKVELNDTLVVIYDPEDSSVNYPEVILKSMVESPTVLSIINFSNILKFIIVIGIIIGGAVIAAMFKLRGH